MNKILKILSVLLLSIVFLAPSCEDEEETARKEVALMEETRKEIRKEFESEYLTEASLFAYETKAIQNLIDFYDYLRILADTSLEKEFRLNAGELIKKLFLPTKISIILDNSDQKIVIPQKIDHFVSLIFEHDLLIPDFIIDSVKVSKPLYRADHLTYIGQLKFTQKYNNHLSSKYPVNSMHRKVEINLGKEIKIFGNDTLFVWNVRFGDIK